MTTEQTDKLTAAADKLTPTEVAKVARSRIKDTKAASVKARAAITPGHLKRKAAERRKLMGTIDRNKSYPQDLFLAKTGMRSRTFANALATGLKVTWVNRKAWITGEDYYEWLRSQAKSQAPATPEAPAVPTSE